MEENACRASGKSGGGRTDRPRDQMDEFFKWLDGKESDTKNSGNQRECSE